jgi:hypothetical protein
MAPAPFQDAAKRCRVASRLNALWFTRPYRDQLVFEPLGNQL